MTATASAAITPAAPPANSRRVSDLFHLITSGRPQGWLVGRTRTSGIGAGDALHIPATRVLGPILPVEILRALDEAGLSVGISPVVRRNLGGAFDRLGVVPVQWRAAAEYDKQQRPIWPAALVARAQQRLEHCGLPPTLLIVGGAPLAEFFTISAFFALATPAVLHNSSDENAMRARLQRLAERLGADVPTDLASLEVPVPGSALRIDRGELRAHVAHHWVGATITLELIDAALAAPTTAARSKPTPRRSQS